MHLPRWGAPALCLAAPAAFAQESRGAPLPDGRVRLEPETRPAPGEGPPGVLAWMEGGRLKAEVVNRRRDLARLRKACS